jgi:hypothetical protein
MTRFERYVRLVGLEPTTMDKELDALDDTRWVESWWKDAVAKVRVEAMRRLRDGESREAVSAMVVAAFRELTEDTGQTITMSDLADEVKLVMKRHSEYETSSRTERLLKRAPFRRGAIPPSTLERPDVR